ncbi:hypothetical protein V3C99_004714, partial [Haemonchus contortus]
GKILLSSMNIDEE